MTSPHAQVHHTTILSHAFTRRGRSQVCKVTKIPTKMRTWQDGFPLPVAVEGADWKGARESDFLMYFKVGEETNGLSRWCSGKESAC